MTDADLAAVLARRRMCRDFTGDPVDEEVLAGVLRAFFRGPAAGNTDALDLVVLSGGGRDGYWDLTLPGAIDDEDTARGRFPWPGLLRAPVLVVPVVAPGAYLDRYSEPDKAHSGLAGDAERWPVPYWWVDAGAAVMALLLAAEAASLGALLFGQFAHTDAVARHIGLPPGRRCVGTVALGHPSRGGRDGSASARRGRPDPASRIHHGTW